MIDKSNSMNAVMEITETDTPSVINTKRDLTVDFLKMFFAVCIVICHLSGRNLIEIKTYTYLAVDFFFLISGFMLVRSINKRNETTIDFLKHKVKIFFPYFVVAVILSGITTFIVAYYTRGNDLLTAFNTILIAFSNSLMITAEMSFLTNSWWYISAMMIAIAILHPVIKKYGKTFTTVYAPLIGVFLLGLLWAKASTIAGVNDWATIAENGVVRAFAEICLGAFIYECTAIMKQYDFSRMGKWIMTITALAAFALAIVYMFEKTALTESGLSRVKAEFLIILALFTGTLILMSEKSYLNVFASTSKGLKISTFLGTGSLLLYLNHSYYMDLVMKMQPDLDKSTQIMIMFVIICVAVISCYYIGNYLSKNFYKLFLKR